MIKLYTSLHPEHNKLRKRLTRLSLLLFLFLLPGIHAVAQCNNSNAAGSITAPSPGNTTQMNACAFAGDYSTINGVTANTSYTVNSSVTTDFFTIRQGTPGGPVIASGTSPLTWTSTTAGIYYSHINLNSVCSNQSVCRVTALTANTCTPPVVRVSPTNSCGGVAGITPCTPLTANGADTYTWSPIAGLYLDCAHTLPYTGGNVTTVYAAPSAYTMYTVTGTVTATGCTNSATTQVTYTPPAPAVAPNPVFMCLGDPAVRLQVISNSSTAQFCSGVLNMPVPDNNPAGGSHSITVSGLPAGCTVTGIDVTINMQHTRVGNMVFVLRAPNGQILNLDYYLNGTGGSGPTTGFVNTIISSAGTLPTNSGSNPYTATFRADLYGASGPLGPGGPTGMIPTTQSWPSLTSVHNGSWTLGFYDGVTGDVGTLSNWCIRVSYNCGPSQSTPAVWSPAAGLFLDAASTIPYPAGTPTDVVYTRPIPAGIYTYAVTTQSIPGPSIGFTNPAAINIPVGGPGSVYPSNVTVSGMPLTGARVSSVVLHGVTHTRSSDLDILLRSPSGQLVMLMSDVGGANPINATYTFVDMSSYMSFTNANQTGTYRPTNSGSPDNFPAPGPGAVVPTLGISSFTGNLNGSWSLFVMDDDGSGDQGAISGGFTINFDTLVTCTSAPRMVVVNVGLQTVVTTQPVNRTICANGTATFAVTATGGGPFNYQWQVSNNGGSTYNNIANAGVYSGVTTATLTVTAPPVSMSGYRYRVVINGTASCGAAMSQGATLTVNPLPVVAIWAFPYTKLLPWLTTTLFSQVTPNAAQTYTWFRNGVVVPGATVDTLLVNFTALGEYQLRVTDINGCTDSSNKVHIKDSAGRMFYVYPNPSNGQFQVRSLSEPNQVLGRIINIYSNQGQKLITRSYVQATSYLGINMDVRGYGKGLFWVEITDIDGRRVSISRVLVQ